MPEKGRPMKEWHGAPDSGSGVTLMVSQAKKKKTGAAAEGIHSHLDVRTHGLGPDPAVDATERAAEVIVIDCSDSMSHPESKIETAREAAIGAVDALRHGTRFAVVQGTHKAEMVYPTDEALAIAGKDTLDRAKKRISGLYTAGGTAIGAWLAQVRRLLADGPAGIRHAMLLTDGRNEHYPELLPSELDACDGQFTCDTWGIGHDWQRQELRLIADRLRGKADIVLKEADLAAKFKETMRASMARTIATLPIRITLAPGTDIHYLKQVNPRERDLTDDGRPVESSEGRRIMEFPTQAWSGEERRQYHLCLKADPAGQPRHEDLRLGMAEVVMPPGRGPAPEPVPLLVHWVPGERQATEMPSRTSQHFELHEKLGNAIEQGCEAHEREDLAAAEAAFREALAIARRLGDQDMRSLLGEFMDCDDQAPGEETLKADFDPRLLDRIWIRRSDTTPDLDPDERPLRDCPDCPELSSPDARYCQGCGREFDA